MSTNRTLELDDALRLGIVKLMTDAKRLGLKEIHIFFSGSGDEGDVNEVQYLEHTNVEGRSSKYQSLDSQAEQKARSLLYANYGSWADGEGASGSVIFDVDHGAVRIEFGWYYCQQNEDNRSCQLLEIEQ